jgi:hypothetical protein
MIRHGVTGFAAIAVPAGATTGARSASATTATRRLDERRMTTQTRVVVVIHAERQQRS